MTKTILENNIPLIEVEMFTAGHGDSLLIRARMKDSKKINILIDCGLTYTFQEVLKEKLTELTQKGEHLSRLIITHIDADHINGALPLLRENGNAEESKIIRIEQIWHNTFRHLQFEKENNQLSFKEKEVLESIIVSGFPANSDETSKEVEIGAKASISLGALILKNNYSWNEDSFGKAICSDFHFHNNIHEDISIHILSPSKEKLDALKSNFVDEIENMGIGEIKNDELFDDAFEYLTSRLEPTKSKEEEISMYEMDIPNLSNDKYFKEDKLAPNGSSIAFVLEIMNKKLLFLGDAHSSQVEAELKRLFPEYENTYPIFFDVIKVSHHGSNGNTSPEFLRIVDSNKFLISTNGGRHHHPDKETIARIVNRPAKFTRNLYFNYRTEISETIDNSTLKAEFNYEIIYPKNCIKI